MGNKHGIAPDVARIVDAAFTSEQPFLDLFCGMCSVAGAISSSGRRVWGNDIQRFAALAAECVLATPARPPRIAEAAAALTEPYLRNQLDLAERFADALALERRVLQHADLREYRRAHEAWRHVANDEGIAAEVHSMHSTPDKFPYRLATLTFAWGYVGLAQAIAIDSIRFALDTTERDGALSPTEANWGRLALLQATSVMASTPGHFAQYLQAATHESLVRIIRQRKRDAWHQFLHELRLVRPFGTSRWRSRNIVLQEDALGLWPQLDELNFRRGVVYADPPYSKDHYSRYYHVLETLTRYDYPSAHGRGRYRPDRFATPFSQKRLVRGSFESLCSEVAMREHSLVLSYPTNGLLSKDEINQTLRGSFSDVRLLLRKETRHSTLGARHGAQHNVVEELVWLARPKDSASPRTIRASRAARRR